MNLLHLFIAFALMACGLANASMPTWTGLEVNNFAQSAQDPSVIYASASPLGVFKSSDHGLSWQPMKLPRLTSDSAVIVHPEQLGHVFVLTRGRSGGYYESLDAGKTWAWETIQPRLKEVERSDPIMPVDFLAVDPAKYGGAWWARLSGSLFRSSDQGKSWQLNAQPSGPIYHTAEASFRFSGNTLFRSSDRGNSWSEIYQFNLSEHRDQVRQFTPLSNGLLMIRHEGLWRQSSDGGTSWALASNGFEQLPDHQQQLANDAGKSDTPLSLPGRLWRTSCRLDVSPVSPADLLARCVSDNGAWPSSVCLKRSDDWGKHWVDVGQDCKATGLPPAWSPTAFLWDHANKDTLWLAWMAGGIYRTTDGGRLWTHADEGLLFPKGDDFTFIAFTEPPLHRAVFHHDLPAIRRLIAEGADINADGNYVGSVLAAGLQAMQLERRESIPSRSLYFELRQLGALPRLVRSTESRLLEQAILMRRTDIVEDLVSNGYDWGLKNPEASGENSHSELTNIQSNLQNLRKPMSYWIEAYIRAAVFPSADQTVMDLFEMDEPALALKVLAAASRSVPFDRQTGTASPVRLDIVSRLLTVKKNTWARRVYEVVPRPHPKSGLDSLSSALTDNCDFALLQAVDAPDASITCILESRLSHRQKRHLWRMLDERGQLTKESWMWLMNKSSLASWIFQTAAYRRSADVLEPLRGLVGIYLEIRPKHLLFAESVKPNSPAMRAGVKAGDQIIEIGSVAVTEIPPENMSATIRGRPGTTVRLKLQRAGQTFSVQLKRQPLDAR